MCTVFIETFIQQHEHEVDKVVACSELFTAGFAIHTFYFMKILRMNILDFYLFVFFFFNICPVVTQHHVFCFSDWLHTDFMASRGGFSMPVGTATWK